MKLPAALTIAGSDSGGGAGIQADLKTFAALRVHGASVITSVTAQNTTNVTAIADLEPQFIRAQLRAVFEDLPIRAVKTGMLHTPAIMRVVKEELEGRDLPIVIDPVMVAKSGARLIQQEGIEALKGLLPLATVITPNAPEAEVLTGLKVGSLEEAERAAKAIVNMGPKAVVVKGGHLGGEEATDLLYWEGGCKVLKARRIATKDTHGTGCSFSSAIAAYLAKGEDIPAAVEKAKAFITKAIALAIRMGKGHGPVNPLATLYRDAERFLALEEVKLALRRLEEDPDFAKLVPETQSNLARALEDAEGYEDVLAVPGRIVRVGDRARASASPEFGASRHVASTLLVAVKRFPSIKAALNVRLGDDVLRAAEALGLRLASYDRAKEPAEVKGIEGRSTRWGAEEALKGLREPPDAIYHRGDWGKEPMMTLLGEDALSVVEKACRLARLV